MKNSTETRTALIKLIEIESDQSPCSQGEFDRLKEERRHSLLVLMRSDDPLLNLVAVSATPRRWVWMNDAGLMRKIQNWLGQQVELQTTAEGDR